MAISDKMKKLKLEVIDGKTKKTVRTYHIDYDETEGSEYRLTVADSQYVINLRGEIEDDKK